MVVTYTTFLSVGAAGFSCSDSRAGHQERKYSVQHFAQVFSTACSLIYLKNWDAVNLNSCLKVPSAPSEIFWEEKDRYLLVLLPISNSTYAPKLIIRRLLWKKSMWQNVWLKNQEHKRLNTKDSIKLNLYLVPSMTHLRQCKWENKINTEKAWF